jgi:acyl-CoA synthetase (AMP-forming)/AMP-acid ligase II
MYLTAGLHRSMQRHPDKIATVTGHRRQTYRQLVDRVARTASALRALGLQPGERLSVLALNSDRMIELLLARLAKSKHIDQIVLATSTDERNTPLVEHVQKLGYTLREARSHQGGKVHRKRY